MPIRHQFQLANRTPPYLNTAYPSTSPSPARIVPAELMPRLHARTARPTLVPRSVILLVYGTQTHADLRNPQFF